MLNEAVRALKGHIRDQYRELKKSEGALAKLTGGTARRRKRKAVKAAAKPTKPAAPKKSKKKKPAADADAVRKELGMTKDKEE